MKIGGNFSEPRSLAPAMRAWRVEKPSASNNVRDEQRRYAARTVAMVKIDAALNSSRFGTGLIHDEEHLVEASFVAQVLGQILGAAPGNRFIAARAYERSDYRHRNPLFIRLA